MTLVANARMYAVTPTVREAWQTLFDWVARTSGVPLEYIDHAAPAPLEALWAREDLITPELFPPGSTHSTFSSNTLGTAVALETLKMLEEEDYGRMVNEKGAYFLTGLRELQKRHPKAIGQVGGIGLALRIEVCRDDGFTPDRELTDRIFGEGLKGDLEAGGKR